MIYMYLLEHIILSIICRLLLNKHIIISYWPHTLMLLTSPWQKIRKDQQLFNQLKDEDFNFQNIHNS